MLIKEAPTGGSLQLNKLSRKKTVVEEPSYRKYGSFRQKRNRKERAPGGTLGGASLRKGNERVGQRKKKKKSPN